jgi:Glycosyltransferase 61
MAVLDDQGQVIPQAVTGTSRRSSDGFAPDPAEFRRIRDLPGAWVFGGLVGHHFGHQITQSLGRLYALDQVPHAEGVLFTPMGRLAADPARLAMFTRLLAGLGFDIPIRFVAKPTRVGTLHIVPDLFSEQNRCLAHPAYARWLRARLSRPDLRPAPGSRLYVTRTRLDPALGRLLCEDMLEANLARAGFQVFAPENHSLPDQIATYARAETIVTTDGSQGHVIAFARQNHQRIVTIARRTERPVLLTNHLDSFGAGLDGASHTWISCLTREWWPQKRADNLSLGEADFATLRDELVRCGALDAPAAAHWRIPDPDQIRASMALGATDGLPLLSTADRDAYLRILRDARRAAKGKE